MELRDPISYNKYEYSTRTGTGTGRITMSRHHDIINHLPVPVSTGYTYHTVLANNDE